MYAHVEPICIPMNGGEFAMVNPNGYWQTDTQQSTSHLLYVSVLELRLANTLIYLLLWPRRRCAILLHCKFTLCLVSFVQTLMWKSSVVKAQLNCCSLSGWSFYLLSWFVKTLFKMFEYHWSYSILKRSFLTMEICFDWGGSWYYYSSMHYF